METNLIFCIELFIIDFLVWLLIKKLIKLKISIAGLLLTLILSLASLMSFLFSLSPIFLIIIRLACAIFISLLITNEYKPKLVFLIFGLYIILSLSVYGYYEFVLLIFKSLNFELLLCNEFFDLVFSICFSGFYIVLYLVVLSLRQRENLQNLMAKVSFSLAGKHIELKGMVDSGNSVYDTKHNLPVIFLSTSSLKKALPMLSYSAVLNELASHYEKCVLVGGMSIYVPIVCVSDCIVFRNGRQIYQNFAIGVVENKFYDEKFYDCLLHKDFI